MPTRTGPTNVASKLGNTARGVARTFPMSLWAPRFMHNVGSRISKEIAAGVVLNAVHFDGTNDWLKKTSDLTDNADGKLGIISVWLKFDSGHTGSRSHIYQAQQFDFEKSLDDKIRISAYTSSSATKLDMITTQALTDADGWFHVLACWDLGNSIIDIFINDTNDTNETTNADGDIDYTRSLHYVGQETTEQGQLVEGDMAQFYFSHEFLNFNTASNRRKFITADGKPVDLGSDGSTPTGTAPIIFLDGATATWHTNKGSGGGFTEVGALTDASSSPSD